MAKINMCGVRKTFGNGHTALKEMDTEFQTGTFTVILGPSGAGKSTLLRLVNGLEPLTSGEITVDGIPVRGKNLKKIRGDVGMIFQQFNLIGRLNVMTNVLVGRLWNRPWLTSVLYLFGREDRAIAEKVLMRVGLAEKAWERADRLSGGQQQRVGIARALAQEPRVILADEPVASLDPVTGDNIMQILREICDRDKITMIVNLHQVDLAKRYADRVIGLNAGEIVFDGTPKLLDSSILSHIYRRNSVVKETTPDALLAYA